MSKFTLIMTAALLAGCGDIGAEPAGYGEKRIELFQMCMSMAKVEQSATHYSPNQKVVDACSRQAYYMTNSLKVSGYFQGHPQ